jgi:RNA polymerase sigma factor (sigma-70 family)
VVVAVQDLRAQLDKPTLHALARHLSDCMLKILRGLVGLHHPNKGEDIIEEVHAALWHALLRPQSKDGQGLRKAFTPRLKFRLLDVLRRVDKEEGTAEFIPDVHSPSDGVSLDGNASSSALAETDRIDQEIDVEAALEQIANPQKRLAFRLHMEGVPFKSKKGASIEEALGVSERTAREWVKEAQEILKKYKGDVS